MYTGYKTTEEYLSLFDGQAREKLEELREAIRSAAPDAVEKISYSMPAFFQNGVLVYFAGFKDHVSLFPTPSGVEAFSLELKPFKTSKGTIQFQLEKPLPKDLIARIIRFRLEENLSKK